MTMKISVSQMHFIYLWRRTKYIYLFQGPHSIRSTNASTRIEPFLLSFVCLFFSESWSDAFASRSFVPSFVRSLIASTIQSRNQMMLKHYLRVHCPFVICVDTSIRVSQCTRTHRYSHFCTSGMLRFLRSLALKCLINSHNDRNCRCEKIVSSSRGFFGRCGDVLRIMNSLRTSFWIVPANWSCFALSPHVSQPRIERNTNEFSMKRMKRGETFFPISMSVRVQRIFQFIDLE